MLFKELPIGALFRTVNKPRRYLYKIALLEREFKAGVLSYKFNCIWANDDGPTGTLSYIDPHDPVELIVQSEEEVSRQNLLRIQRVALKLLFGQMDPPPAWATHLHLVAYWEDRDAVMRAIQPYKGEERPFVDQPISSSAGDVLIEIDEFVI